MDKLKIELLLSITIKIGSVLHISFVAEIYALFPRSAENRRLKGRRFLSVSPLIYTFNHRNISSSSVEHGVKFLYYNLKGKLEVRLWVGTVLLTLSTVLLTLCMKRKIKLYFFQQRFSNRNTMS
jgi:hypothetical protein